MLDLTGQLARWWRRRKPRGSGPACGATGATATTAATGAPATIIGRAEPETDEQRLARLGRWCVTGRAAAAELALSAWRRCPDCPADAIALLAALYAQTGRTALAAAMLESHLPDSAVSEPPIIALRIALLAAEGHHGADGLTRRLHREHGHDAQAMRWLDLVGAVPAEDLPAVSDATIEQLAGELLDQIEVLPSLVAAQRIERDAQTITVLRGGVMRMLRDLDDDRAMLTACQALADLAMLAGDEDDARRWAHRGLRIDPYAAHFAIILSRVADDPAIGPPASSVLKDAVNAHPKYPDLRAALIRREFAEGRLDIARRRLTQWLQREPNQALAIRLQHEIAA